MKILALLLLAAVAAPAVAQNDVEFRCTDDRGQVSVQDRPCPSGMAQVIQRRGAAAAPTVVTSVADEAVPQVLDSARPPAAGFNADDPQLLDSNALRQQHDPGDAQAADAPPMPPVFRCVAANGSQYLHAYEPAPPTCALLTVTGLGGATPVNAASCEIVRDSCEEIAEAQRCGAWQQLLRTARGRERFAGAETQAAARAAREQLQAVLDAGRCPVPG